MNIHVLLAVFRRNFLSYFANPTGYVFICVFVLLSSIAAFWTPQFFNANLANLDQLNFWFPFIMLVFVPAITMSIWADERRQGTDELLLTIPAGDFDIVLGKYLAAVAIYTVALVFSLFCNFFVLAMLGAPDPGLFFATYFGYWLVGLAMLAVGMVASFLTSNLTVSFVLGALFNAPLVFLDSAKVILPESVATELQRWSIGGQLHDFGRGVISLSNTFYFLMIAAVMLYLCVVLIGRRHWLAGSERAAMVGHYVLRAAALFGILLAGTYLFSHHDVRADATAARLSSLSPQTRELLAKLDPATPVRIQAFISPHVPEPYVQTRLNLLSALREIEAAAPGKVQVEVHETDRYSDAAQRAEESYNIQPRKVGAMEGGRLSEEDIYLHVQINCGPRKTPQPIFFDRDLPVEYELVHAIASVAESRRKKIGVLQTDAQLYGGFDMQRGASPNWPIIDELEKQYEVVRVDPSQPIADDFDALLAVQPSSLPPEQLEHFIDAVRAGIPTAIFEDPLPAFAPNIPATSAPRQPPSMNPMMMMQGPLPKGDINKLWELLGIDFTNDKIVWQDYNPLPAIPFEKEFVFIGGRNEPAGPAKRGAADAKAAKQAKDGKDGKAEGDEDEALHVISGVDAFNPKDPISAGLQQMLFVFPGSISKPNVSPYQVDLLVRTTHTPSGTVRFRDVMQTNMFGGSGGLNPERAFSYVTTNEPYTMAVAIHGALPPAEQQKLDAAKAARTAAEKAEADKKQSGEEKADAEKEAAKDEAAKADAAEAEGKAGAAKAAPTDAQPARPAREGLNVVLVADLDMLTPAFFRLREQSDVPELGVRFDFDNVTFALNVIDALSGDTQFIELRKRRALHRTLTRIEVDTHAARVAAEKQRKALNDKVDEAEKRERAALEKKLAELQKDSRANSLEVIQKVALAQQEGERRMQTVLQKAKSDRDRQLKKIDRQLTNDVSQVQNYYKLMAVLLPPIPPLLVAAFVFFLRRSREKEGVARSRLL